MIKALMTPLALTAGLILAPAAFAQDRDAPDAKEICEAEAGDFAAEVDVDMDDEDLSDSPTVRRLEAAARVLGEKMERFGARAHRVCEDASLSEDQKEQRIAALWAEHEPDLTAFTTLAAQLGPQIAAEALSEIDIAELVEEAMAEAETEVEASGAMAGAMGVARNNAWASDDPEHRATLGLVAEYAAGEAMDAMETERTQARPD